MDIDICPLLEGDRIILLYTSFNLNQWDEWFRKVWEIWLLKLPQGGLVLTFLNGTTGEIVMQLILRCNSKTIFYKGKKILKYNNNKYCIVILYGFKMYLLCNMCFHWLLLTVNNCSTLNEWPYWILQTSVCLIIAIRSNTKHHLPLKPAFMKLDLTQSRIVLRYVGKINEICQSNQ